MVLDRLDAQSGGGMGLCGSGTADQHDVLGTIEDRTFVQLSQHGLVDLAGHEVEADKVFVSRGEADQKTVWETVFPPNPALM